MHPQPKHVESDEFEKFKQRIFSILNNQRLSEADVDAYFKKIESQLIIGWQEGVKLSIYDQLSGVDDLKKYVRSLCQSYKRNMGVCYNPGIFVRANSKDEWQQEESNFECYRLYENFLKTKNIHPKALDSLEVITSDVLHLMGNPRSGQPFGKLGLLMGDVQSGKTQTYTGVCHKAIDSGYRFIVVLSGTKTSLRNQTQARLKTDLVEVTQGLSYQWRILTDDDKDFEPYAPVKLGLAEHVHSGKMIILAVMQKNSKVLQKFLGWLKNDVKHLSLNKLPLLLIDDEADTASINSNKPEETPTAINRHIRSILSFFDYQKTYLGVTATPFANVFADPQLSKETSSTALDAFPELFPRDFIYALPPPDGYLGVERLFGQMAEEAFDSCKYKCLIPLNKTDSDREFDALYHGQFKALPQLSELPATLKTAILYFLLCCYYRDEALGFRSQNTSMLIHVVRVLALQKDAKVLVQEFVQSVVACCELHQNSSPQQCAQHYIYQELENLWDQGCQTEYWYRDPANHAQPKSFKTLSKRAWREVWGHAFTAVVKSVCIVAVNSDSKEQNLSKYYDQNKGHVIVIGGDALNRGLTLEGLCVSYFMRPARAYDTLLQVGRWFGYRLEAEEYMKIWLSDYFISMYSFIASAVKEFRESLFFMHQRGKSPQEFGLKIRLSPKNEFFYRLSITNVNKLRHATRVTVHRCGKIYQSSTLSMDSQERSQNKQLVREFLSKLPPGRLGKDVGKAVFAKDDDWVWQDVPGCDVGALLRAFKVPSWSDYLLIEPLAELIIKENVGWDVRIMSKTEANAKVPRRLEDPLQLGLPIEVLERSYVNAGQWIMPIHRSLVGSSDFQAKASATTATSSLRTPQPGNAKPQLLIYLVRPLKREKSKSKLASQATVNFFEEDEVFVHLAFRLPDTTQAQNDLIQLPMNEYMINAIARHQARFF